MNNIGNSIGQQVVSPEPEQGVTYLEVTDTTCTPQFPSRTHHITYQGRPAQVTFEYGKALRLPFDAALKFLKEPAFIVIDPNTGEKFDPTPKAPEGVSSAALELAADEVIAKLDELTQEALFLRAKQLDGSDHLKKGTPKTELIAFLAAKRINEDKAAKRSKDDIDAIPAGASVGGAMPEDALSKLIPDDAEAAAQ